MWERGPGGEGLRVAFILLNPSVADASRDDPTVRRCLGFARSWGYGRLDIVNLFAYRATSPAVLRRVPDPIGPDNDRYLVDVCQRADLVVAAWGNGGLWLDRASQVLTLVSCANLVTLGTTQRGQPRHPLYLGNATKIEVKGGCIIRPRAVNGFEGTDGTD